MILVGCDFHPSYQQAAVFDTETGEVYERILHCTGEVERFYRELTTPPSLESSRLEIATG